jgi:hypothetical protein
MVMKKQLGEWLGQVKTVNGRKIYCLSGGYLKNERDVKNKVREVLSVEPNDALKVVRQQSPNNDSWNYWLAYGFSDCDAVGTIPRDQPYYDLKRRSNILTILANNMAFAGCLAMIAILLGSVAFLSSPSRSSLYSIIGILPFMAVVIGIGDAFMTMAMIATVDKNIRWSLSSGYALVNNDGSALILRPFLLRMRCLLSKNPNSFSRIKGTCYSIFTHKSKDMHHALPYSDEEVIASLEATAHGQDKLDYVTDEPEVDSLTPVIRKVTTDADVVRNDILSAVASRFPKESPVSRLVHDMLESDEITDETLAHLESVLHDLNDKTTNEEEIHNEPIES